MSSSSQSKKPARDVYTRCFAHIVDKSNQAWKTHIRLTSATITEDDKLRYDFFTRSESDREAQITHIVDDEYHFSDALNSDGDVVPWRLVHRDVLEELKTSDEAADALNYVLASKLNDAFALGMDANTFSVDGSVELEVEGETYRVLLIAPFAVDDSDGSEPDSTYGSGPVSASESGEGQSSGDPTVESVSSWVSGVAEQSK
ncbi:hypothetical protein JCM24511_01040 [Saitozyma sp. JCM 24511]|nr:hypothetical protein JCM24511_01040 [Saitozyma sp. JCM 24511]